MFTKAFGAECSVPYWIVSDLVSLNKSKCQMHSSSNVRLTFHRDGEQYKWCLVQRDDTKIKERKKLDMIICLP